MGTNGVGNNGKAQKPTVIKVNKKKVEVDKAKGGIKLTDVDDKYKTIFKALDGQLKNTNGQEIGAADNILDSEEMQVIFGDLIQMSGRNKKLGKKEFQRLIEKYNLQDVTVEDLEQFYNAVILGGENITESKIINDENGNRVVVTEDKEGNVETRNSDGSYSVKSGNTTDNFNSNGIPTSQSIDDGEGTITTVEYDLESDEERKPAKKIIATGQTENTYEYQENGNELLTRTVENKDIPTKEKITTRQYDANQQLVGMQIQEANVETSYEYDEGNDVLVPKEEIINAGTDNEIKTTFQVAGADLISETQTQNGSLRVLYSIESCNNREQIAELKKKSEILVTENGYHSLTYDESGTDVIETETKDGDNIVRDTKNEDGSKTTLIKNADGYEQVTQKADGTIITQQEDNQGKYFVKTQNTDGTITVKQEDKSKGTSITQKFNSQNQLTFSDERDNKGNITQTTYGKDRITVKKWDSDQNFGEVVFNAHTKKQISQRQVPGPKLRAQMAQERERALAVSLGVNPNSMSKYNSSNNTIMVQLQDNGTKKKAVYRYTNTKTGKQESFTYTEYSNYAALPKYDYNTGKVIEMKYEMANTGSQGTWYYNDPDHRGRQKPYFYMNKAGHTAKPVFNARGEIISVNYSPHFNTYKGRIIGDVAGTRSQVLVLCNGKYYYVDRNDGHVTTPKRVKGEVAANYAKQHGTQKEVNTVVADNYHRVEGTGNIEVTGIGSQGKQTLNSMGETVVVNGKKMDLLYDQYGNKYVVPTDGTFTGKELALYNPKEINNNHKTAILVEGDVGAEVFNRYQQAVTIAQDNKRALSVSKNIIDNMINNIDMVLDSDNPDDGFTSLKEYSKGDGASWDHRFVDWLAENTFLGSKNEADTRRFLESKKKDLQVLRGLNPNTQEFKNKFKQVFGVNFDSKNLALYYANSNSNNYKSAFGDFNAEQIGSEYIESQYSAAENLKTTAVIGSSILMGAVFGPEAAAGTAGGVSAIFDTSHLMTTGREVNWNFFEKDDKGNVKFDSNGLPVLGDLGNVVTGAAKETAFFAIAGEGYKAIELSAQSGKAFAKTVAGFMEKNAPKVAEITKGLESQMTKYATEAGYKSVQEAAEQIMAKQAAKTVLQEAEQNFLKYQGQRIALSLAEYEPAAALNVLAQNGLRQSIGAEFAQFTTQVLPKTVAFDVSLGMSTELATTGQITPEGVATYATQSLLFQVGMRGAGSAYSRFKGRSKGEGPEITEKHELPPSNQSMSSTLADAVKPDPVPPPRNMTRVQRAEYERTGTLRQEQKPSGGAFSEAKMNGGVDKGGAQHNGILNDVDDAFQRGVTTDAVMKTYEQARLHQSSPNPGCEGQGLQIQQRIFDNLGITRELNGRLTVNNNHPKAEQAREVVKRVNEMNAKEAERILNSSQNQPITSYENSILKQHLANNCNTLEEVNAFMDCLKKRLGTDAQGNVHSRSTFGQDFGTSLQTQANARLRTINTENSNMSVSQFRDRFTGKNTPKNSKGEPRGFNENELAEVKKMIAGANQTELDEIAQIINANPKFRANQQVKSAIKNRRAELQNNNTHEPIVSPKPSKRTTDEPVTDEPVGNNEHVKGHEEPSRADEPGQEYQERVEGESTHGVVQIRGTEVVYKDGKMVALKDNDGKYYEVSNYRKGRELSEREYNELTGKEEPQRVESHTDEVVNEEPVRTQSDEPVEEPKPEVEPKPEAEPEPVKPKPEAEPEPTEPEQVEQKQAERERENPVDSENPTHTQYYLNNDGEYGRMVYNSSRELVAFKSAKNGKYYEVNADGSKGREITADEFEQIKSGKKSSVSSTNNNTSAEGANGKPTNSDASGNRTSSANNQGKDVPVDEARGSNSEGASAPRYEAVIPKKNPIFLKYTIFECR